MSCFNFIIEDQKKPENIHICEAGINKFGHLLKII